MIRPGGGLISERGGDIIRHDRNVASAFGIIDRLIQDGPDVVLNSQHEPIDYGKILGTTKAGKAVEQDLQKAKKKFQNEKKELEEQHAQALRDKYVALVDTLKEQRQQYNDKLRLNVQAQADLRIDWERLVHKKHKDIKNLEAKVKKMNEEKIALWELLLPLVSVGMISVGVITGDTGTTVSGD